MCCVSLTVLVSSAVFLPPMLKTLVHDEVPLRFFEPTAAAIALPVLFLHMCTHAENPDT